jgi:hypothetical protein
MLASIFDVLSAADISTKPDGSLVIQSSYLRIGVWLLAFLVLASVSLVLIRKRSLVRFAIAGFVCSLAILIIVLPGIFTEKLELTANRLTAREGVWFSPKHYDVDLDGLAFIHESTAKGAFHQPKVSWFFKWRDGRTLDLVLPDLLAANQDVAIHYLHEHGVEVVRAAEEPPGEEPHGTFAAIAYSPETGKYGYASECKTKQAAEQEALRRCAGPNARIVTWVHNGYCALAVGDKGAWGGGWSAGKDASSTAAKEHSLAECKKRSDQARLLTCVCSFRAGEE